VGAETGRSFRCFGGTCSVFVAGDGAAEAVAAAQRQLLAWHRRFTRFDPASELSLLNADPRDELPVSRTMARLVQAAMSAAELTGGLVDATLLPELEAAGYRGDISHPLPLALALRLAPPRRPAAPRPDVRSRAISLDEQARTLRRPAGLAFDSGGIAKGLFADLLAERLTAQHSFAVNCAGDLRLGGAGKLPRNVEVAGPFDARTIHSYALTGGGVATSGIGRRTWLDPRGRPAHHLIDPATGRPAFTGVVQATALAPTALEAEIRAKAAVLAGPQAAPHWLPHGGVVVLDDGSHRVIASRRAEARGARLRRASSDQTRTAAEAAVDGHAAGPASSSTRWATAKAEFAAGTPA
jgi:thiamine biosynthesis lipoprotein